MRVSGSQRMKIENGAMRSMMPTLTRVGDQIETSVMRPMPGVIRMTLLTSKACAYADQLLADSKSGWHLIQVRALSGDSRKLT